MIVLDASAALEWLLSTPLGVDVAERISDADETLHAPHLLDLEVAQVLRRYQQRGEIDAARGSEGLAILQALDLERYPHDVLLPRIWQLREVATAYDAAYLALAEALAAPLLTADAKLARTRGHRARVELLRSA